MKIVDRHCALGWALDRLRVGDRIAFEDKDGQEQGGDSYNCCHCPHESLLPWDHSHDLNNRPDHTNEFVS